MRNIKSKKFEGNPLKSLKKRKKSISSSEENFDLSTFSRIQQEKDKFN